MTKKFFRRLGLFIVLFATVLCISAPMAKIDEVNAGQEAIDEAERKLNELKEKAQQLQNQVDSMSNEAADIKNTVATYDNLASQLSIEIYSLENQISDKATQIDSREQSIAEMIQYISSLNEVISSTRTQLATAQETEAEQYEAMKLRIQYMYENGDVTFIDMLFQSENMADFLNKADYISEISEYDREQLAQYVLTKDTINELLGNLADKQDELSIQEAMLEREKNTLEQEKTVLETYKAQQEIQKSSYDTIIAAKNNELSNLETSIANTQRLKEAAEQEVADQQVILDQARAEYAAWLAAQAAANQDASLAVAAKLAEINVSGFTWPLPGYNRITSEFGNRFHPILQYYKLHDGMDISGADVNGKPIVAAYPGTVILSEYYWGYGECIKIDHGGSIQTLYAHMSARIAQVGQYVNAGDVIGLVGSTGNSTGPHLHLSLIISGEFVNPRDYFVIP